jgi:hypothetical protein
VAVALLALGIVAIVAGSVLFYKMKAMLAARRAGGESGLAAARFRALSLLLLGATLTAASIPANLLASTPPSAGSAMAQGSGLPSSVPSTPPSGDAPDAEPAPSVSAPPPPPPPAPAPTQAKPPAAPRKGGPPVKKK